MFPSIPRDFCIKKLFGKTHTLEVIRGGQVIMGVRRGGWTKGAVAPLTFEKKSLIFQN